MASGAKVPIVYTHYGRHQKLTAEQERIILDVCVRWKKPADCKLWFIAVHYIGKYSVWAEACYEPDSVSPRMRKGRSTYIHVDRESELVERKEPDGGLKLDVEFGKHDQMSVCRPSTYVQVSRPGMPFSDKLDVPPPIDLPFPPPVYPPGLTGDEPFRELTDDELVKLIDFVRAEWVKDGGALDVDDDPVCWVVGNGDDVFGVARGVSDWGGDAIHVRLRDDRFEVVGHVGWADADTVAWPPERR